MSIFYNYFKTYLKLRNLLSLNFSLILAINSEISIDFFVIINYIVHKQSNQKPHFHGSIIWDVKNFSHSSPTQAAATASIKMRNF